jgi:hypothetical protein
MSIELLACLLASWMIMQLLDVANIAYTYHVIVTCNFAY